MSEWSSEHSIADLARFLTEQLLEFSQRSTTTILEGRPSRVKKFINRFSKNPERERQRLKLQFHLFIAYLAVLAVELQVSEYWRPYSKQIVREAVDLFYGAIKDSGEAVDGGLVIGDEFIKDPQERKIIMSELRRVDETFFAGLSGLPKMGLTAIADMLLEKRLNEYREMWIDDMTRIGQDGFIALMPTRVYQHWSGENPRSMASISFGVLLSAGLMPFSASISQVLEMMRVKPSAS
ncbi:MAG: hypothetical protein ACR2HX_19500 [Pyrinomonadaceae bacterium]